MAGSDYRGGGHGLAAIFYLLERSKAFLLAIPSIFAAIVMLLTGGGAITFIVAFLAVPLCCVFLPLMALVVASWRHDGGISRLKLNEYIDDKNGYFKSYGNRKIPIETVIEAYMHEKIDFKKDVYETLLRRNLMFRFCFTWNHFMFYFGTFISQNFGHSIGHDQGEIAHVYNRGNDFYGWFLGPSMIYTSGIYHSKTEKLEDAQNRKLDTVCRSVRMKKGDVHLDLGCGWGTLLCHAAANYGTTSYGVTLAQEQVDFCEQKQSKQYGVKFGKDVNPMVLDYRKIPTSNKLPNKFDCITCLEMAEHVGIKNFQNFLLQVKAMLKDDGIFYLQIAGLRRAWQFEDLVWGLFMGKYIFPAADASCPLAFVVGHLERAGYEVHRVENTGVHYSLTIKAWYDNWVRNRDHVVAKYSEYWYRMWAIFLAWSAIIAAQGSSTVFMITAYKNHKNDKASVSKDEQRLEPFGRMDNFVGPDVIGIQQ